MITASPSITAGVVPGLPASTANTGGSDRGAGFAATLGNAVAASGDAHAPAAAAGATSVQASADGAQPTTAPGASSPAAAATDQAPAGTARGTAADDPRLAGRPAATRRRADDKAAEGDDPQSAQLAMLLGMAPALLAGKHAAADARSGDAGAQGGGATGATVVGAQNLPSGDATLLSAPGARAARTDSAAPDADPIHAGVDATRSTSEASASNPGTSLPGQAVLAAAANLSTQAQPDAAAAPSPDANAGTASPSRAPAIARQLTPATSTPTPAADPALPAAAAEPSAARQATIAGVQGSNTTPVLLPREFLGTDAASARGRGNGRIAASAGTAMPARSAGDPGTSPAQPVPLSSSARSEQWPHEKSTASGPISVPQANAVATAAATTDAASTASSGGAGAQDAPVVAPPVGSPHWPAAIAQHLARAGGSRNIELHLNPQDLGPLNVKLSLVAGHAQVAFVSEHLPVRQALEAALPQLRSSLAENGISLGQATVGSGTGGARPDHGRQQPAPGQGARTSAQASAPADAAAAHRHVSSGVDTFA